MLNINIGVLLPMKSYKTKAKPSTTKSEATGNHSDCNRHHKHNRNPSNEFRPWQQMKLLNGSRKSHHRCAQSGLKLGLNAFTISDNVSH